MSILFQNIFEVIMFDFGFRLKSIRKSKNLTQKEVAESIKITERSYQRYEANEQKPTHERLVIIADFFDVSLDYLLGRKDL